MFFSDSIFVCLFLARLSQRLKVSYCDGSASVVVVSRATCVRRA